MSTFDSSMSTKKPKTGQKQSGNGECLIYDGQIYFVHFLFLRLSSIELPGKYCYIIT